jgi:hypothetical protein
MAFPIKNGCDLNKLVLSSGGHRTREAGQCVMEATAHYHWDHHCYQKVRGVHPYINAAMVSLNDHATDEDRQKLKVLIPHLANTAGEMLPADPTAEYSLKAYKAASAAGGYAKEWDGMFKTMVKIVETMVGKKILPMEEEQPKPAAVVVEDYTEEEQGPSPNTLKA